MNFNYVVIIVTCNRLELLKECLDHAANQTYQPLRVIIVNNASNDGTKEFLDSVSQLKSNLIIQHLSENIGGAGGFYTALEMGMKTEAEWFMLIDDDAILDYECMEYMNPYKASNHADAYACTVVENDKIGVFHRQLINGEISEELYQEDEFVCQLASFCGLMINRNLVNKIGFPLKEYFIWYDDTEYSMRINKETNIIVISKAKLVHKTVYKGIVNGKMVIGWKTYYGIRNQIDMYKRYKMWPRLWDLLSRDIVICIKKYLKSIVYGEIPYKEARLYKDAICDGLIGRLGKNKRYLPPG